MNEADWARVFLEARGWSVWTETAGPGEAPPCPLCGRDVGRGHWITQPPDPPDLPFAHVVCAGRWLVCQSDAAPTSPPANVVHLCDHRRSTS